MARPTKQGIDYFPLDCSFDGDVELLIAEFGAEGLGILIMIWQRIYRDKGNYVDAGDDLYLMLKRESLSSMETVKSCVEKALSRGIFSLQLYKQYGVLTSSGVQRRYFEAAKQKKSAVIKEELLLIDVSMYGNAVIINGNAVIINGNASKVEVKVNVNENVNENVNVTVNEARPDDGDENKKNRTTSQKKQQPDTDVPPTRGAVDAASIYELYPKKVDKGHAIKAINTALKKVDAIVLLESVKRYAAKWEGKDKQYCPNPASWFNGERWDDESEPQPQIQSQGDWDLTGLVSVEEVLRERH